jgi:diguanylate cyclase (GGDEF)-like protein
VQKEEVVRAAAAPYAIYFCYGVLAAAVLLSWYQDQARLLSISLAIGLSVWAWGRLPAEADLARLAAVFLLPLNFIFFEWMSERGVLTLSGVVRLGFVGAQVLGVAWFSVSEVAPLRTFLHWGESRGGSTSLPRSEEFSFVVAALVLLGLVFRRRTRVEQGMLWALVAVFLGVNQAAKPEALFIYSGTAALMLVVAVLEYGYELANRDELTGLPSRRAFNRFLEQLGRHYAIAMCDVDHFKQFNDTHGHEAGDQVLRIVASMVSKVQGGGKAFRYGGEEFVLVFPGRSAREAQAFVESLCKAIAERSFELRGPNRPEKKPRQKPGVPRGESLTITISGGVAEQSKRHSTPELVLDAADAALYLAKESGRNCVRLDPSTPACAERHNNLIGPEF